MDRSDALNGVALFAAFALVAGPLLVPPEAPPDRIEFYVEPIDGEESAWETLDYSNLSTDGRRVVDAARSSADGYHNATLSEVPPALTPPTGGIDAYDLEREGTYYLLQVKHVSYEIDAVSQVLPRLGALAAGVLIGATAGYRQIA